MKRTTANALRLIAALTLLLAGSLSTITAVSAQGGSVDVAVWTRENGNAAYDACYVLVGYSDIGCDENGDGKVMFSAIPYGTYTVRQTADLGPGRYVEDFTIQVTGPGGNSANWQSFTATIVHTGGASSGQTSDVAIVTTANGQSVTDACYVLVNFSDEGCDENRDGKITFQDIPLGTYTVHQTANLGSGRSVGDFTIRVTGAASGDGWERFVATVSTSSSSSGSSGSTVPVDIALITRDPQDGHLLTGTCYVLIGFSNEGCDENGDGQVTFAAIPSGTYTVHQTRTPAGYPTINDYDIVVQNQYGVPLGFIVKQATAQNAPNTRNVSVVYFYSRSSAKVTSSICVQFAGASNVGCDEDLIDGQIDFLDVPAGTYEIKYSNIPAGWQIMGQDVVGPIVTIDARSGAPTHQIIYVEVYVP
jgi:hypothetical protein